MHAEDYLYLVDEERVEGNRVNSNHLIFIYSSIYLTVFPPLLFQHSNTTTISLLGVEGTTTGTPSQDTDVRGRFVGESFTAREVHCSWVVTSQMETYY